MEAVVVEECGERLLGGDLLPANGYTGLRCGFAVRADLAEADFGIEHIIDFGLAREIPDSVGQRHVVHDDEGDDGLRLGRVSGVVGGGGVIRRSIGDRSRGDGVVGGDLGDSGGRGF